MDSKKKQEKRLRRHQRIRAKISGTSKVPRLCVFRSSKHINAQLIDDEKRTILAAACDMEIKRKAQSAKGKTKPQDSKAEVRTGKVALAYEVGKLIAKKAEEKKIKKVVFDRGGYKYHGRVKALATGAREGGLKF